MRKIFTAASLFLGSYAAFGQLTGTSTVPGTYPTLEAAFAALNASGVGTGGATINVAAGYTETPSGPLVLTMSTSSPTAANPLVIQKSGAGANPLITAHTTGTSTILDGLFILNGVDYVTVDGIDLQENAANVTTTTQMEFGYALLKTSITNGSQYNTIKNATVTLNKANTASVGIYIGNHTTASVTALTVASLSGTSSYNKFYNNTVTNAFTGYSFTGYASGAPYDLYDQGNQVGVDGVSTRRSQVTNYGGSAGTANGITASNQNAIKIFNTYINNTGGAAHTGTLNGILLGTGTNSNLDVYNDTLTLSCASAGGSTLTAINSSMGATGAGNTVNFYNNVVDGCTYATNTSGVFRGINSTATASYTNMYGNKITNNSIPGTGDFSGLYFGSGSSTLCLALNFYNNIISGNAKTGTAGIMYLINANFNTFTTNCYGNQLFNNSNASSSGATYGYYNFSISVAENVYNNTIYNNAGGSGEVIMLDVRSGSAANPTGKEVYGNTIYGITGNTTASVGAIRTDYGSITNIYRNTIYGITNNSTTGGTPATFGILVTSNANLQSSVYNNYISELYAPASSNTSAIIGIWLQGTTNCIMSAYYNTVYINASSTGANFGTLALNCGASPSSIDLRNNILVNTSTAAGTGLTRALGRSSAVLTTYALTSGYNCLYAGTPSATNLLFWDGVNSIQTTTAFRNLVGPRDQSSFSSLPPFINIAVSPYNLHLQNAVATQCEGGGTPVAGLTTDYDGATRNATTPDVGADEITGITTDIAAPNIQYTLLTNSSVAATRVCTNFATITDPSGINTTVGTRPRLYYKRSTNANTYNSNVNGTDGWKYVEASNTSSPFSFTIDYSLLFGGGVVAGDIIQYFVVAQDLNGTPIVGHNYAAFTTVPSSVNLTAANFPATNTLNQYTIVAAALSGTINVGPAETITSLTNAGGIFQAINSAVLSGNVTISITGDLTAETGTFALNQWAEEGVGNYTVSIVPSAATVRNIYGSNAGNSLIRFDGADRVNVDGRFGGIGNYLLFRNTSNAAPTIGFINDAQNNTVQYSIIESGNTSTSATIGGALVIGSTTGPNGNDNNTISNCEIRDRSDVTGNPSLGINIVGNGAGTVAQFNNNCTISNNNIHDWYLLNGTAQFGINIGVGNTGFTISGNSLYQTVTRTHTVNGAVNRAIFISNSSVTTTNGGFTVTGNFIGGTAPGATGGDLTLTTAAGVTQTFGAISIATGQIPNSVQNNVIRKIDFTTAAPSANTTMWFGMNLGQGVFNCGTTTGNVIGDATATGSIKISINTGGGSSSFFAGILAAAVNGYMNIQNNTIGGITIGGTNTTAALIPQWIQMQGTPSATCIISNNLIGSTTTANSIQVVAATPPVISFAVRQIITSGAPLTMNNNTIQNISDASVNTGSADYAMLLIGTAGSQGALTITNNTIKNFTANVAPATPAFGVLGISIQGFAGLTHTITGNQISGIYNTNTSVSAASYVVGIQTQGSSLGGVMSKNRIWDLQNANRAASPGLVGVYLSAGLRWDINNNMISVINGSGVNDLVVGGVIDFMALNSQLNMYYNSIFIGGNVTSGVNPSSAYSRGSNSTANFKDNLLYNRRGGGTGTHAAISATAGAPAAGWAASNYNAFITADTSAIGVWGLITCNMNLWRSNSGGDANSIREISSVVSASSLFVNAANGDLHINTSTYPEALATPIAGITVDYDNNARSATFPTIGADELPCSAIAFTASSQTNIACNGGNTGSATVSGTGGNGITYSWSPSGGNAPTATGLTAGTYTCSITNICGNNGTVTVTITQPAVLAASVASQTNVTCNGSGNGSATLSVTGGTTAYTYAWAPSGGTSATASTLAPGGYTCTITDANGCTTTQSVNITEPAVLVASAASQTNVGCNGGSSGDATVSVTGGTTSYSYSWAPSGGTAATASGLIAGLYTCTVTDANGCTATQTFNITEPTALVASPVSQTNINCNGNATGDAVVSVTGGAGSYTYSWTPSGGTAATASGLTAGVYTCTITDANSCTTTQTFNITEPTALSVSPMQTNVACNGGSNGDAMVMVSGGAGSYTYNWAPSGGSAATASGLTAGTYTCTVTDANSCTIAQVFTITEPAVLASSVTTATNPSTCGGTDGAIDITVSGGTTSYTFSWSNSSGTEDISGLAAGNYSVTVTDANGCTSTASAILNDPTPPAVAYAEVMDTVCQTTQAPFALSGATPAGGTYSGTGVSAGIFDPAQANLGYNVITYTFTDTTGCTGIATDSIWVDICTGIATAAGSDWTVFPNPTMGKFEIHTANLQAGNLVIEIFAADGRLVRLEKQTVSAGTTTLSLDLGVEPVGIYSIRLINNNAVFTTRLIRQ